MSSHRRPYTVAMTLWLALAIGLAGCASGATNGVTGSTRSSATTRGVTSALHSLALPAIHTIGFDAFDATYLMPGVRGVVLLGRPASEGNQGISSWYTTLYYSSYDDSTHGVRALAAATRASDGTERQIAPAAVGGDWVAYLESDSTLGHKALSVVNVMTGARHLVVADLTGNAGYLSNFPVAMDDSDLVYAYGASNPQQSGMFDYHLSSGTATRVSGDVGNPVAVSNGTLIYTYAATAGGPASTWALSLSQSAPASLSSVVGGAYTLNDRYIVWDEDVMQNGVHTLAQTLTLYDRSAGKMTARWLTACGFPALDAGDPYLVCQDRTTGAYRLVQVPSGKSVTLRVTGQQAPQPPLGGVVSAINGRAYFPAVSGVNGLQLDYVDLPTS